MNKKQWPILATISRLVRSISGLFILAPPQNQTLIASGREFYGKPRHLPASRLRNVSMTALAVSFSGMVYGAENNFACMVAENVCNATGWSSPKCALQKQNLTIVGANCENPSLGGSTKDWDSINRAAKEERKNIESEEFDEDTSTAQRPRTQTSLDDTYPAYDCVLIEHATGAVSQRLHNRCGFDVEINWRDTRGGGNMTTVRAEVIIQVVQLPFAHSPASQTMGSIG